VRLDDGEPLDLEPRARRLERPLIELRRDGVAAALDHHLRFHLLDLVEREADRVGELADLGARVRVPDRGALPVRALARRMLVALEPHLDEQGLVAERGVFQDHAADVVQVDALHDADRRARDDGARVVGVLLEAEPVRGTHPERDLDLGVAAGVADAGRQRAREPAGRLFEGRLGVGVADVVRVVEDQAIGAVAGARAADRARPPPAALVVLVVALRVGVAEDLEPVAPERLVQLVLDDPAAVVVLILRELGVV
jgi:hypothetical protein